MTVLILNATGRSARAVLSALLSSPSQDIPPLRLHARSELSLTKLRTSFPQISQVSKVEYATGDVLDAPTLARAMHGIETVWYNGPPFISQATAMGIAVVDAAVEAGVKHLVFASVLHPYLRKLVNHIEKLGMEEYLVESGLPYTILQPTHFMDNLIPGISSALKTGQFPVPYTSTVLQGYLSLVDFAEVSRLVLLNPEQHARARYELIGENNTGQGLAKLLSEAAGKTIEVIKPSRETVVERFCEGKGPAEKEGIERLMFYYDRRGIPGSVNILRWLLGREPTTWKDVIAKELNR